MDNMVRLILKKQFMIRALSPALLAAVVTATASGCSIHRKSASGIIPSRPPKYAVPAYEEEQRHDEEVFKKCKAELEKVRDGVVNFLANPDNTWPSSLRDDENIEHPEDFMCDYILPGYNSYEECVGKVSEEVNTYCAYFYVEKPYVEMDGTIEITVAGEAKPLSHCVICVTNRFSMPETLEECKTKTTGCRRY